MKKIAVLLAQGFEEIEALLVVDVIRRANFVCDMISVENVEFVTGAHNIRVQVDKKISDISEADDYDLLVLPGGMPGTLHLKDNQAVISLIKKYATIETKYIAAICAAPIVLAEAGVITGYNVTSYPDEEYKELLANAHYQEAAVVVDRNIITSRGAGTAFEFAYTLVDILGGNSTVLKESMVYQNN